MRSKFRVDQDVSDHFLTLILSYLTFKRLKSFSCIPSAPGNHFLLGHVIPIIQYSLKRKFLSLSTFIGEVIENHPELYVKGVYKVNLTFLFPVVVVLSPGHASQLFKRQTFEKPLMSAVIHFVLKGLFNLNGEEYKKHKRILAPAFKTTGAVDRVHDTFYLFEEDMKTKDNISFVMDDT